MMELENTRIIFKADERLFYRMTAEARELKISADELEEWAWDVVDNWRQDEAHFGLIDGTHDVEGNRYDSPSLN